MKEEFLPFDVASMLEDDESIEYFLADIIQDGDAALFVHALGTAARAKGMTEVAKDTGLAREALYRSFSEEGNPSLKSTFAVLKSLGLEFTVRAIVEKSVIEDAAE